MTPIALYLHAAMVQVERHNYFDAWLSLWEAHKHATGLEWAICDGYDVELSEVWQICYAYKLAIEYQLPLETTRIPYVVELLARMASSEPVEAA